MKDGGGRDGGHPGGGNSRAVVSPSSDRGGLSPPSVSFVEFLKMLFNSRGETSISSFLIFFFIMNRLNLIHFFPAAIELIICFFSSRLSVTSVALSH